MNVCACRVLLGDERMYQNYHFISSNIMSVRHIDSITVGWIEIAA